MFHKVGRKKRGKQFVYQTGKIVPILTASDLLASSQHQTIIERVESLSEMPEAHFRASYHLFIRRFAEFVQVLPRTIGGRLCGLLNVSLLRAVKALTYFVEEYDDSSALERFALFSAALLKDVSRAFTSYSVIIVDEEGKHLQTWDPMQGPLTQHATHQYYKLLPFRVSYVRLKDPITAMLSTELLPPTVYEWLTLDRGVFSDWLDALFETGLKGGRLSHILDQFVDEMSLNEGFTIDFKDLDIELMEAPATEIADQFIEWLNEAIERGEVVTTGSDPELHIIEGGAFIEARVLEKFERLYNFPNNVVSYSIGNLFGVAKKGSGDFRFDQFFKGPGGVSSNLMAARGRTRVKGIYLSERYVSTAGKAATGSTISLTGEAPKHGLPSLGESVRASLQSTSTGRR